MSLQKGMDECHDSISEYIYSDLGRICTIYKALAAYTHHQLQSILNMGMRIQEIDRYPY